VDHPGSRGLLDSRDQSVLLVVREPRDRSERLASQDLQVLPDSRGSSALAVVLGPLDQRVSQDHRDCLGSRVNLELLALKELLGLSEELAELE
jgi:hypothetical protein